jgi:flagellar hook-associated protein 3 FlgL
MRITNSILRDSSFRSIQTSLQLMAEAQQRASSGLRVSTVSDDPAAAAEIMGAKSSLRATAQYRRNIDAAMARSDAEESALDSVGSLLARARELGMAQGDDSASDSSREIARQEVLQLLDQAVSLGNSRFGDAYLFGGVHPDVAPFTGTPPFADPLALPSGGSPIDVGDGVSVATHSGVEAFLDTGALQALSDLADALGTGDAEAVRAAMPAVDQAYDAVQVRIGEVGARANQLTAMRANLDALDGNLQTLLSNRQDVDMEQAISDFVARQMAYQSALLATSRVVSTSLADYLR